MTGLYRLSTTATGTALFTKILYVRFFNVGLVPMGFSKFHLVNLYEELESDIHLKGQLLVGLQIHEGRKNKAPNTLHYCRRYFCFEPSAQTLKK